MSTPNWDPRVGAAANHVNEMKHEALGAMLQSCGWYVRKVYGTFASIRDYKDKLFETYPGSETVFNKLREYYDVNMLAVIFAPLFPAEARNCLWILEKYHGQEQHVYELFPWPAGPWSSSELWEDMLPEDN